MRAGGARGGPRPLLTRRRTAPVRRLARRAGQGVQVQTRRGPGRRARRRRVGARRRGPRGRLLRRGRGRSRRRRARRRRRRGRRARRGGLFRRPRRGTRRRRGRARRRLRRDRRRLRRDRLGRGLDRSGGPILERGLGLRIVRRRGGDLDVRDDRHRHRVHQRLGLVLRRPRHQGERDHAGVQRKRSDNGGTGPTQAISPPPSRQRPCR
ncbi:hypothetical protein CQ035_10945 [Brevundimonas sp. MYb46]|nr:hypothetical protein CQ026_03190 [Brevundimonas sp. MYb31]PRA21218.1 hypothetical protein CQ024_16250 [Brevundimonas sp. MYb27]PRB13741.1 hypothetical protein CQ039_11380 [Brevundimonas sp. MYb52]PRB34526.1 hypothetical protein CQ035_10945 [Brevundimonas sp. MYb46]PRB54004.1 hypothetical protein CQ028_05590 [Brevundimonas sp. MYb33]